MVDVAAHSPNHRADAPQALKGVDAADVARMPDFVASGEMDGIAVVPARVGRRQQAYFLDFLSPMRLAVSAGTAALFT